MHNRWPPTWQANNSRCPAPGNARLMDALQQSGSLIPYDDKAIWKVQIFAEDWPQANTFTVLRFPLGKIWSDPSAAPIPFQGSVTPEGETKSTATAMSGNDQPETTQQAHEQPLSAQPTPQPTELLAQTESTPKQSIEPSSDSMDIFSEPATPASVPTPSATESPDAQLPPMAESGQRFLAWLRKNMKNGLFEMNTASGRIHRVQEGLLLISPGIFKDYRDPHPDATWQHVQRRFARLRLHEKMTDGTNIHVYQVVSDKSRKRSVVKGFLIAMANLGEIFPGIDIPSQNPYLQRKATQKNAPKTTG